MSDEIGPNHARNERNRRRIKRQRRDAREVYEAVERGDVPKGVINRHLARLLREERRRSWAVAEDLQLAREAIRELLTHWPAPSYHRASWDRAHRALHGIDRIKKG